MNLLLNSIVNDEWVIFLGFFVMGVALVLGLMLFFRLMKLLKLRIKLSEQQLKD